MNTVEKPIYEHEHEQASNAYLMSIVGIISGLPLPVVNLIASAGYYLGVRKSTYYVRWHAIQAMLAQAIIIPFNSIAFGWTLTIFIWKANHFNHYYHNLSFTEHFPLASLSYWLYISFVILLNIAEFITVLYTASRVRNGHNVRWAVIASITDKLTSKENRDIYTL